VTPPFPEHNSTHAATGAAAAGVLALTLGDQHVFTVESPTLAGVSRSYQRFTEAAAEEGLSRIYCGIHFRNGMNTGLAQGDKVAEHVVAGLLRRVDR
jgi:PAP2 superfamily